MSIHGRKDRGDKIIINIGMNKGLAQKYQFMLRVLQSPAKIRLDPSEALSAKTPIFQS